MLCIADRVMGAEIHSEFMSEPQVIIHPPRAEVRIAQQELGLEPIERHALEIGLGVDDLCAIIVEGPRVVLEVQLALHEEHTEFLRFGTVELVRFADLGPTLRFGGLVGGSGGTSEGGNCSCELRQHSVHRIALILVIITIIVGVIIWGAARGTTRRNRR